MAIVRVDPSQAKPLPAVEPNVEVGGTKYHAEITGGSIISDPTFNMTHIGENGATKKYGFGHHGQILGKQDGFDEPANPGLVKRHAWEILNNQDWIKQQGLSQDYVNGLKERIGKPPVKAPGTGPN